MASPRTPEPEDSATEPKTRKPFILNRWLRTGWNWYKESMQGYGAAWPRITTLIVATLLVVWLLLHIGRWTDFDSKSRVAQLEGQLKEARAQSGGNAVDISGLATNNKVDGVINTIEDVAKSEEIATLTKLVGEVKAELAVLKEKSGPDISGLATAEALAALKASLAEIKPTIDTSALETALANLGTKVGEIKPTDISAVETELKALRGEIAKIPTSAQVDSGALEVMTMARDGLATQLRASEAKLADAERKAAEMEKFADDSLKWLKQTVRDQLKYEFVEDANGGWALNPVQ